MAKMLRSAVHHVGQRNNVIGGYVQRHPHVVSAHGYREPTRPAENRHIVFNNNQNTRAWRHRPANRRQMSRKVVFSICALLLLLSLCLVEAKKKKNVLAFTSMPPFFSLHAFAQPKSDVEKMKENCLQIVAISAVVVVVVEIANYMLSYGRPAFRATSTKLISTVRTCLSCRMALLY